jgi:hypothetical protein
MVLLSSCYKLGSLAASLPQMVTNGYSLLGTQMAPQYPPYMTDNPMPDGYPWGNLTARKSNPYKDCPETGVTRYYDWTVQQMTLAPDGYCITIHLFFLHF